MIIQIKHWECTECGATFTTKTNIIPTKCFTCADPEVKDNYFLEG